MSSFTTQVQGFLQQIQDMMQMIIPFIAMIGILGAAVLYFGANFPVIKKFKEQNPDMITNIVIGFFLVFIASGAVALIPFS